jgi:hypothetical protein
MSQLIGRVSKAEVPYFENVMPERLCMEIFITTAVRPSNPAI